MKKLAVLALATTLLSPAYADVRYTKKVTMNQEDSEGMSMHTTTFLKNRRERIDTVMQAGPMKIQQSELTLCDLEKKARLDSDLKIYTSSSLRPRLSEMRNPMEQENKRDAEIKSGTGTYTMTYTVKDLGTEKIANLNTRHFRIQVQMESTGCAGDSKNNIDREVWIADLPRLQCPVLDASGDFSLENQCKIKVVQKGDVALYFEAMKSEPVKEILYLDGKPMMTTELTDYSSAALEDSIFSLDGLKQVSDGEFQQQIQSKMMRQFTP